MKKILSISAAILSGIGSTNAAFIASGDLTGIIGVTDGIVTTDVANFIHPGSSLGTDPAGLFDGSDATGLDTFNTAGTGGVGQTHSFVGATFAATTIDQVVFRNAIFVDGGWFGTNTDANNTTGLIAPTLQVQTAPDTWITVATINDYVAEVTAIGDVSTGVQVVETTFDFTDQVNVTGVRLIGLEGGNAGNSPGFIAATEFQVNQVPEPSSTALLGLGSLALILRRRK